MYLSHILLMIVIQYALLAWAPYLSRVVHFAILLACATVATIAVSAVLYLCIEAPGIYMGHVLARRFAPTGQRSENREPSSSSNSNNQRRLIYE